MSRVIKSKRRKSKRSRRTRVRRGTSSTPLIIGKLHASWCGHCQTLAPIWDNMKNEINQTNNKIVFVEMEEKEIPQKTKDFRTRYSNSAVPSVQRGFPTIFKGYDNKIYYYDQDYKDEAALKNWLLTMPMKGGCDSMCNAR